MCEGRKKEGAKKERKKESHVFGSSGTCWPWFVLSAVLRKKTSPEDNYSESFKYQKPRTYTIVVVLISKAGFPSFPLKLTSNVMLSITL